VGKRFSLWNQQTIRQVYLRSCEPNAPQAFLTRSLKSVPASEQNLQTIY